MKSLFSCLNVCHRSNSLSEVRVVDLETSDVVGIAGSFDMGYGTKVTGRTYDSCTGHASLFGHESKKLIGYQTKTRKCFKCDKGHSPDSHNCQGVYDGTA